MEVIGRKFSDWDNKTKRKLRYATLPGGYLRKFMQAFPQSPTIVVFAQRQQVMGWAFALRNTHNSAVLINLFVNKQYRRQGIATLLVEEALKSFGVISLAEWDNTTQRLFRRLQKKHSGRIIVFNWWKNIHSYKEIVQKASSAL